MDHPTNFLALSPLLPAVLMLTVMLVCTLQLRFARAGSDSTGNARLWRWLQVSLWLGLLALPLPLLFRQTDAPAIWGLAASKSVLTVALLVQILSVVIARFSSRCLHGEGGQVAYIRGLAGVLASVHLLLLADHWLLLILAWSGAAHWLKGLLCFYPERPFARLAARKKEIADRVADVLLVLAAVLAWQEVGTGSLSELWLHLDQHDASLTLKLSALALALAVILRTALLPVHGWLIQVMEAPTPVSALLHAGVVNLGGLVLIRFAPLLQEASLARWLLGVAGLATAILAGMVMMTRISIKVRLAWSTTAQMGFMVLECALGLYTLALLHLIGHSIYKAHAFLAAASIVEQTRKQQLYQRQADNNWSLFLAPVLATTVVLMLQATVPWHTWPLWWTVILGFAWAPLLWLGKPAVPTSGASIRALGLGLMLILGLSTAALIGKALPFDLTDAPDHDLGWLAMAGMIVFYGVLVLIRTRPEALQPWRRWSYAGFYLDEAYTRLTLKLSPTYWNRMSSQAHTSQQ